MILGELTDDQVALELAKSAARLLTTLRGEDLAGRELGAEGDRRSQQLLTAMLQELRPGDSILSEEGGDDGTRVARSRVWILDPLDGTREFAERNRTDWAVHVALWEEGELVSAVVGLPAKQTILEARRPPHLRHLAQPPRMVVSRSRPPSIARSVAKMLGSRMFAMGSAGAKVAAVLQGQADVYLHAGGQYEWDSAAPVGVALAAGLHASRIDGAPLRYNQLDPYLPDLLVCHPDLAEAALAAVAAHSGA